MKPVPAATGRVLVNAAPRRVDESGRGIQRLPCAPGRRRVTGQGTRHVVLDVGAIQKLLWQAQPAALGVVIAYMGCQQTVKLRFVQCITDACTGTHRPPFGRRVFGDGGQQPHEIIRRDVACALDQLGAVGGQKDQCRPTVIAKAISQRRLGVMVGAHHHEVLRQQRHDGLAAKRLILHDVAPVAPHCFEVQKHRLALGLRLLKGRVGPGLPDNRTCGVGGVGQQGQGQGQPSADETSMKCTHDGHTGCPGPRMRKILAVATFSRDACAAVLTSVGLPCRARRE